MEMYSTVLSLKKNKDYFITSMSCYVDLVVDVIKLKFGKWDFSGWCRFRL